MVYAVSSVPEEETGRIPSECVCVLKQGVEAWVYTHRPKMYKTNGSRITAIRRFRVALSPHHEQLLLFKRKSTHRVVGGVMLSRLREVRRADPSL